MFESCEELSLKRYTVIVGPQVGTKAKNIVIKTVRSEARRSAVVERGKPHGSTLPNFAHRGGALFRILSALSTPAHGKTCPAGWEVVVVESIVTRITVGHRECVAQGSWAPSRVQHHPQS